MVKNVNDVQRIVKLIRDTGLNTYSLNDMLETCLLYTSRCV